MNAVTNENLTEAAIQAGANMLLEQLGNEMPGLWDLWDLKERHIEDAVTAVWQSIYREINKKSA